MKIDIREETFLNEVARAESLLEEVEECFTSIELLQDDLEFMDTAFIREIRCLANETLNEARREISEHTEETLDLTRRAARRFRFIQEDIEGKK